MGEIPGVYQELVGKVAVITGASRGIGRAIALRFASAGATVILSSRNESGLKNVADEIKSFGGFYSIELCDVTVEEQVKALTHSVMKNYRKIDVLVNNAGIGFWDKIIDIDTEDFDRIISVNTRGAFLLMKYFGKQMSLKKSGHIINISSIAGKIGTSKGAAYNTSKFGLVGLSRSAREDFRKENIKVTVIYPGWVNTDLIKYKKDEEFLLKVITFFSRIQYTLAP